MKHIAEKGGSSFHGIKLLLCENPSVAAITDKPKACNILIKPLNCLGIHNSLPQ